MTHAELTPDEADRLTGRLRRLAKRRGWSGARLCRELPISSGTWGRLTRKGFMTRRTAEKICRKLGWEPLNVLASTAARRPSPSALFLPAALQEASRYCTADLPIFRAQLLHAAAAYLLIQVEDAGSRAQVLASETLERGSIRVLTHYPGGLPRAEVRFELDCRRLVYALVTFNPAPLTSGRGEADALGFDFCLEFLTVPLPRDKLDGKKLDAKILQQLTPYG